MATILRFPIRTEAEAVAAEAEAAAERADLERLAVHARVCEEWAWEYARDGYPEASESLTETAEALRDELDLRRMRWDEHGDGDHLIEIARRARVCEKWAWEAARDGYLDSSSHLTTAAAALRNERWNDDLYGDHSLSHETARRHAAAEIWHARKHGRLAREYGQRVKKSVQRFHGCALREELRNRAAAAGVPLTDYVTAALWRAARQNENDRVEVDGHTLEKVLAAAARAGKTVDEWLRQAAALGLPRLVGTKKRGGAGRP